MSAVTLDGLTREAKAYNNVLAALPAYQFNELAGALGLNVLQVSGEDINIATRRGAGILKGYAAGLTPNQEATILSFFEQSLKPLMVYGSFDDNITQYKTRKVISNQGEMTDNKTKKHPLEAEILRNAVSSFNEDIIFNVFFAERGVGVENMVTPATAFNGFKTKIDALVVQGLISAGNGNLITSGAIAAPANTDDTTAYDRVVTFLRAADPMLKRGDVNLMIAKNALSFVRDAFKNKVKAFNYPTLEEVIQRLRDDSMCPGLQVKTHEAFGNGGNLILTKPGNLDLGFNVEDDKDYVQVRAPYTDPNLVQFWIQASIDTRVKDINKKVFATNEQSNTSNGAYAGDVVES